MISFDLELEEEIDRSKIKLVISNFSNTDVDMEHIAVVGILYDNKFYEGEIDDSGTDFYTEVFEVNR